MPRHSPEYIHLLQAEESITTKYEIRFQVSGTSLKKDPRITLWCAGLTQGFGEHHNSSNILGQTVYCRAQDSKRTKSLYEDTEHNSKALTKFVHKQQLLHEYIDTDNIKARPETVMTKDSGLGGTSYGTLGQGQDGVPFHMLRQGVPLIS